MRKVTGCQYSLRFVSPAGFPLGVPDASDWPDLASALSSEASCFWGVSVSAGVSGAFSALTPFFDFEAPLPFRPVPASGAVSIGNGMFGSTFFTMRKEARMVFSFGSHSRIVYSGNK